jgi:divalent metal cation (Fe/Co/Zn/Cd) transporter
VLADVIVALIVAVAIAWTAWRTIREASAILTDAIAADVEEIAGVARSVRAFWAVMRCARGASSAGSVLIYMSQSPLK